MRRAIAAIDDKRGIATDTGIPWDVPADRAYFREATSGSAVLMGFATYEEFAAPLPDRRNLVATRRTEALRPGFEAVPDATALLAAGQGDGAGGGVAARESGDIWVIGGGGLYAATLALIDELYLTRIPGDYGCTKFFPAFEPDFVLHRTVTADDAPDVEFQIWARHAG